MTYGPTLRRGYIDESASSKTSPVGG